MLKLPDVKAYLDITESDVAEIPHFQHCIGIYVGGTGSLVVRDVAGNEATFSAVPVGQVVWGRHRQVRTGSTASLLVALYGEAIKLS